jgi:hypothetical protein
MQRAGAEAERFGSRLASSRALNLKLDSLPGWAGRWYGIIGHGDTSPQYQCNPVRLAPNKEGGYQSS